MLAFGFVFVTCDCDQNIPLLLMDAISAGLLALPVNEVYLESGQNLRLILVAGNIGNIVMTCL